VPGVATVLGEMRVSYALPKHRYLSRTARAGDAATILVACESALENIPEGDDRCPYAQALTADLRNAINTIEMCEFPGMYR
jgi:hypothetical protein